MLATPRRSRRFRWINLKRQATQRSRTADYEIIQSYSRDAASRLFLNLLSLVPLHLYMHMYIWVNEISGMRWLQVLIVVVTIAGATRPASAQRNCRNAIIHEQWGKCKRSHEYCEEKDWFCLLREPIGNMCREVQSRLWFRLQIRSTALSMSAVEWHHTWRRACAVASD